MDMTKQEFEQILDKKLDEKLDTKFDEKLKPIYSRLTVIEANMVTKAELTSALEKQSKELKEFAEEQTDHLASIIGETVAIPMQRHLESCQKITM
jgi:hypothetical protein